MDNKQTNTRGECRKTDIIRAALDIFGEYGPKGATVRMIANEANANVASIPYYFNSKDGLYTAMIEYITDEISKQFLNINHDIAPLLNKNNITKSEGLQALHHMMAGVATLLIESDEPKAWAKIITREQANPTSAFDILYDGFIKNNQTQIGTLIAAYTGLNTTDDTVKIIAHTLMGQMLGFLICREDILRSLNVTELNPTHVTSIQSVLKQNIESCLNSFCV